MALRQSQHLKLLQKLSPQQIQVMKLLQLPTVVLEQKIKEELELNPALEEDILSNTEELETDYEEVDQSEVPEENDFEEKQADKIDDDYDIEDYMGADEIDSYKYEISNSINIYYKQRKNLNALMIRILSESDTINLYIALIDIITE